MSSIGTLFAFILVSLAVIILRKKEPGMERTFRTPLVPYLPVAGMLICIAMIYGLGWTNWLRLGAWLLLGLAIYFGYGRKRSLLK